MSAGASVGESAAVSASGSGASPASVKVASTSFVTSGATSLSITSGAVRSTGTEPSAAHVSVSVHAMLPQPSTIRVQAIKAVAVAVAASA
jgi:exo-beta-1,3-glucanase (GH17 family)